MKENVLARRYAKALFEISNERRILDNIRKDIAFFDENLRGNQDLSIFLHSKEISKKEKIVTIEKLLQDRVSNVFFNFVTLLLKKNREGLFITVVSEFDRLVDRHNKRVRAKAHSAVPLDADALSKIKLFLDREFDADVHIENRRDPSILGGVIVDVGGQVYNGSLRNQLFRLRAKLVDSSDSRN
ncbi:ATP synthase F1 subunit delta [bacterium]|nr:ATP synthase F1 subunit delta [bacterium]